MATSTPFILRPLDRRTPDSALKEAFRVHLSTKDLQALGVVSGDLIRLSSTSGKSGFGIAWPAQQTNPGNKSIAKVTDFLREKYGAIELPERVFVEKVGSDQWAALKSVEVSLNESPGCCDTPEELQYWIRCALVELEIIVPGGLFDVQQKGPRVRQKSPKIRATVESIDPPLSVDTPLYFDPLKTQVIVTNSPSVPKPSAPSDMPLEMKSDGIGGLSEQVNTINRHLAFLNISSDVPPDFHLFGPTSILIHGPEGTGKSMLLNRLAEASWREVMRLDLDWLSSNPKAQSKGLAEVFSKARESEPSLVVMDDLDKFLAKAETLQSRLKTELKKLEGSRVVVAAATRSVYDIDASLRTTSAFKLELEIFPPNVKQREDMVRQIVGPNRIAANINYDTLAERTHGFVGRDIHKLCSLARNHRIQLVLQSLGTNQLSSLGEVLANEDFVTQANFDAVIDQVRPTVLQDSVLEVPKVRWTDIAGLDHVRQLLESITSGFNTDCIQYPNLDTKFGGPQSRKGVLLYGPPGCAKTLIAQAVATESNQNFLAVKGSELIKMYIGESERAIRDVFRRARAAKPCIIFFDEIDSIGKSREKSQDSGLNVVATLLNEMDGIEALKEVFIIGATNRPDILDSALIRTGRFDAHIHIGLPNREARRQIFQINTRKRPLAGDVDLDVLASGTEGSSGADIKGLCSVAVELAISDYEKSPESPPEVRMCHFQRALDTHVPHTIKEEAERYENWRPGKSLSRD
ncbi:P-loop containing nucleoside triphosphate hydrolase protein [Clohesyomyces aquaticus]|uniref:p-loop containing nucleoside triphosphate hydrolase protein n=1 Tax=Clohesyomyces aquaticus TaxID=1231657 RepID=A0A1Y1YNG2_9PLEO|nr:P-loop containing nucleoside triphosphate hydrolase protein [Clohesyomyces aquaticus]